MAFYDQFDFENDPYAPRMGGDAQMPQVPPQYVPPSLAEQLGIPDGSDRWDSSRLRLNGQMVPASMLPTPWVGMPKTQATLAEDAREASKLPALLNQPPRMAYEPAQQIEPRGFWGNWHRSSRTPTARSR